MLSWITGILCLCLLLGGCGGKAAKAPPASPEPPEPTLEAGVDDQEDTLAEQLSSKRLEELYSKSGLQGVDPILEGELKAWDQVLKFDVPIAINKQVKAYLVYFTTERKNVISRYLSRSSRYLPMIREIFQEHGLPEDLAYLAMIESGFNPHAYSHAHACGMWQFIRGTGLRYGLTINNYLDERRDPEKSTHAAAKYLTDLYKQFGSWYLAAASYNCGEGRVQRELNNSTHKNFWELSGNMRLPTETKNYVPQMIAATIIAKNPEKFGFTKIPYLPTLQYDKVTVDEPTSLKAVSVACNVPPEEIELLNPELRRGVTPPEIPKYSLKIPKNARELFARNIQTARIELPATASEPVREYRKPTVRRSPARVDNSTRKAPKATASRHSGKATAAAKTGKTPKVVQVASLPPKKAGHKTVSSKQEAPVQMGSVLGGGSSAAKTTLATKGNKSATKTRTPAAKTASANGKTAAGAKKGNHNSRASSKKGKKKVSEARGG